MERFYSLIILSGHLSGKEITLPAECYIIHLSPDSVKKEESHNEKIYLDIISTDTSLKSIELTLFDNNYTVCYKTDGDIFKTEKINYNIPFTYNKKTFFSIKKMGESWHNTTLEISKKNLTDCRKPAVLHSKKSLLMIFSMFVILIILWLYDKNMNENNNKDDVKTIINKFIRHHGYIQENHHFLFIIKSDNEIPDNVYKKMKPYVISMLKADALKHNDDDIINIYKNDTTIEITYISSEENYSINDDIIIPDVFKNRLKINKFSFSDIITLINESIKNDFISYTIVRNDRKIIVLSEKENNENIKKHIDEINKKILNNNTEPLVSYKQIKKAIDLPGIYGKQPYRIISGDHIDFTLHNK
ncbi:hypothetical protein L9H26_11670 [Morganella psychrotolerans]|uniref:Uncharacterized protein n=1 Tax=Morganella psychrotolerans TaxID=368603 RepID=A0A5M9R552_9GAMM|nr:hypothetical protein [Morganella psychrotolerans]KAA8715419.1 hypothetical protein F4V73_10605 [Morganella psychrotolerans]